MHPIVRDEVHDIGYQARIEARLTLASLGTSGTAINLVVPAASRIPPERANVPARRGSILTVGDRGRLPGARVGVLPVRRAVEAGSMA
jgi:hypothetical protein